MNSQSGSMKINDMTPIGLAKSKLQQSCVYEQSEWFDENKCHDPHRIGQKQTSTVVCVYEQS